MRDRCHQIWIVLVILGISVTCLDGQETHFQGFRWGASIDEIVSLNGTPDASFTTHVEDGNSVGLVYYGQIPDMDDQDRAYVTVGLSYQKQIYNMNALTVFKFDYGVLSNGLVWFRSWVDSNEKKLTGFSIRNILSEEFGKPFQPIGFASLKVLERAFIINDGISGDEYSVWMINDVFVVHIQSSSEHIFYFSYESFLSYVSPFVNEFSGD